MASHIAAMAETAAAKLAVRRVPSRRQGELVSRLSTRPHAVWRPSGCLKGLIWSFRGY